MRIVTADLPKSPEACWRVLVDAKLAPHWVPGLRRATVVVTGADELPAEVHFEFAASLTYSLVYSYDVAAREMRFEPRLGKRDGVRGFARIESRDGGARLVYGLEPGPSRAGDDLDALVASFAHWMSVAR